MNKGRRAVVGQGPQADRHPESAGRAAQSGREVSHASFLRTVAHDLKGPLTAIRGQAQLLQLRATRQGRAADVKATTAIVEQVQRMTALLDGLLEAVLAQDGTLALALAPLNLVALATAAVDAARASAPGQTLIIHAAEQDLVLEGDAARLARVLDNLLDDILRRSPPERQIHVGLRRQGAEILLTIGDVEGAAAPAVVSQAEPSGALDLPVYVSQRIIEAHGGRFWTGSSRSGIQFVFTLPARTPQSGTPGLPSTG